MNPPRERSAVVAAWLEEGPNELPDATRRAIAVDVRTTHQARRSTWFRWRFSAVDRLSLVALAAVAVAVMVVAIAGLAVSRITPDGSNVGGPPPVPSASPSLTPASAAPSSAAPSPGFPTTLPIPPMQQTYFSELHGYTVSYPVGWSSTAATQLLSPPDWKAADSPPEPFDFLGRQEGQPMLRAASARLPDGLPDVNDWIDEFLTHSTIAECAPPRETWELVTIDGAPGRLRDSCGEVEVTVVLDGRVYMFTLFPGDATHGRELFNALAATIDLRPEDAAPPSPDP